MRSPVIFFCCLSFGLGCSSKTIRSADPAGLGELCYLGSECESGLCIPYGADQVCSIQCPEGDECTNGTVCRDHGDSGRWCLPESCVGSCEGKCCGYDECGEPCPDTCPGRCNTITCECELTCSSIGETRPCTAHGTCLGTESCQDDYTWSECVNEAWSCTEVGTETACMAGACQGVQICEDDCALGACTPSCPALTECCSSGCVDLETDSSNCGACERECLYASDLTCYHGTCCFQGCKNGNEICDDEVFTVPSPYKQMYLACRNSNGGIAYIATNTGPPSQPDNHPRCRGWEESGEMPWEPGNLNKIYELKCSTTGDSIPVDLSAYAGSQLYVGVHDDPAGGGHNTGVCITVAP